MTPRNTFQELEQFFNKTVCAVASAPLRKDIEIGIQVDENTTYSLVKREERLQLLPTPPSGPDITFKLGLNCPETLSHIDSEDIGEIGVKIFQLMLDQNPDSRINIIVHSGYLSLFLKGYFGILATGGQPVLSFLAKRGLGSVSGLKAAVSKLKGSER